MAIEAVLTHTGTIFSPCQQERILPNESSYNCKVIIINKFKLPLDLVHMISATPISPLISHTHNSLTVLYSP